MYTGIVGCALVAGGAVVGAPPLPAVGVDFVVAGEPGVAEWVPVGGCAVSETEHGLALGEAVTVAASCALASVASVAVPVVVSVSVSVGSGSAVLESVGDAAAESVASAESEADADAEAGADAEAVAEAEGDASVREGEGDPAGPDEEAVGVLEHAADVVSACAGAGSTSEVP